MQQLPRRDNSLTRTGYKKCQLPVRQIAQCGHPAVEFLVQVLRGSGIFLAFWAPAGMAERKDCLVATPHWGT
jgi:hypothetical protein